MEEKKEVKDELQNRIGYSRYNPGLGKLYCFRVYTDLTWVMLGHPVEMDE